MPITFDVEDNIAVAFVTGVLSVDELHGAQDRARDAFKHFGHINLLVYLDHFEGWEESEEWGDLAFSEEADRNFGKIAYVGDIKWKEPMFLFAFKDMRELKMEYFETKDKVDALHWLKED